LGIKLLRRKSCPTWVYSYEKEADEADAESENLGPAVLIQVKSHSLGHTDKKEQ
jgi:hypothetical protein